jgi:hypothetical protein
VLVILLEIRFDASLGAWRSLAKRRRACWDVKLHTLYIADVGQNKREEIDIASTAQGGLNYGWNLMKGSLCFTGDSFDSRGLMLRVLEYGHDGGACAIVGGFDTKTALWQEARTSAGWPAAPYFLSVKMRNTNAICSWQKATCIASSPDSAAQTPGPEGCGHWQRHYGAASCENTDSPSALHRTNYQQAELATAPVCPRQPRTNA